MSAPERFKVKAGTSREGRLMALGGNEMPDRDAIRRAAQRLGVSATVLTSASAASAMVTSAATSSAAASKLGGSLLMLTLAKGILVGVGIGMVAFGGLQLVQTGKNEHSTIPITKFSASPSRALGLRENPAPKVTLAHANAELSGSNYVRAMSAPTSSPVVATARPIEIAANATTPTDASNEAPKTISVARFDQVTVFPHLVERKLEPQPEASNGVLPSRAPVVNTTPRKGSNDLRLAREVSSLDRVRILLRQGSPADALSEWNRFESGSGYSVLRREALLVRIDVLLALGQRTDAAVTARQVLNHFPATAERTRLEDIAQIRP